MIEYITGNIFNSNTQALVNTVNCVGVMGRGIALQFKNKYPNNFKAYQKACKQEQIIPGKMFVFATGELINPQWIINFPTKRHWKEKSRIEDIKLGLDDLVKIIQENNISSIAIPPLGAGLGGLNWKDVRQQIEKKLSNMKNVSILVYEPNDKIKYDEKFSIIEKAHMTSGRAVLIRLINDYLNVLLDPFISLLEVHKLMYFMQEAGEDLRLNYVKHHYGPYAENLRHVLNKIEGHFISGYADGGDMPNKPLELVKGASDEAEKFLNQDKYFKTRQNFEYVSELVQGFESAYGLELLATVHWIVCKENIKELAKIIECVYKWNEHKKRFTPRQIEIAYNRLKEQKWFK